MSTKSTGGITLHSRTMIVNKARVELASAVISIAQARDLTTAEIVSVLTEELAKWPKYLLRAERHPNDPDKKADEA